MRTPLPHTHTHNPTIQYYVTRPGFWKPLSEELTLLLLRVFAWLWSYCGGGGREGGGVRGCLPPPGTYRLSGAAFIETGPVSLDVSSVAASVGFVCLFTGQSYWLSRAGFWITNLFFFFFFFARTVNFARISFRCILVPHHPSCLNRSLACHRAST